MNTILQNFGNIDVYLFDQLLKGRFLPTDKILDAGCGSGRNLVYFLLNNFKVYGIDRDPESIHQVKQLALRTQAESNPAHIVVGELDALPWDSNFFDAIICNAVLHFAENEAHFHRMLENLWKVLKPEGHLLIRLASDIGIEDLVEPLGDRRFYLPDGSIRFLVNQQMLLDATQKLGGSLFEYIKTTNVQNLRCMTTWCLKKGPDAKDILLSTPVLETLSPEDTSKDLEEEELIGTIIEVPFINKGGRKIEGAESLFLQIENDQYFIKIQAGKVSHLDLQKHIDQPIRVRAYKAFGVWDSDDPNVQSRIGAYLVLLAILE